MAGLPFPLRALLFPLVLLTLMTFVVMPVVTRLLRHWLDHDKTPNISRESYRHSSTFISLMAVPPA